jgi:hypothetical protein
MPTTRQRLAIVGDLHYETNQQEMLNKAREQLRALEPDAVVSLGDQGGYTHCGTRLSFEEGYDFFSGFGVPFHPLIGNHDMEGVEFKKDKEAVATWCEVFERERPYGLIDWGTAVGITLSQTSFRNNIGSHHDVHIDEQQLAWFAQTLAENSDRPIFVFSHAPILGSGIRVLQDLHLKGPNAYLNHYTYPERFIQLVQANPQIKLWFSGHNHLGHEYDDTISQVGHCTFVHGGVIGNHTRDGRHHTRFLTFDKDGFDLHTVDHDDGRIHLDARADYASNHLRRYRHFPQADLERFFPPPPFPNGDGIAIGQSVLLRHRDMLVEYDRTLAAPVGIVADNLNGAQIDITDEVVLIRHSDGKVERREKNEYGRYLRIYFPNPWLRGK